MNRFIAHNMPKIELHCHLDGSVSLPLIQKLMQQEGKEPLGLEELREKLVAPMDCSSLAEYLEKFELPLGCLQTKEGLSAAAQDLALSAAKEQVKYLEVRFAPAFSMEQGLSVREILESVRDGLKKAEEKADILTGMIVCTMRNLETEKNIAMLKEAREFLGNGVVACDLAGDEKAYPTAAFADVFATAKKYGMPYTIHAGECGSREEIRTAIEHGNIFFGFQIAHGADNHSGQDVRFFFCFFQAIPDALYDFPDRKPLLHGKCRCKTHFQILDLFFCCRKCQILCCRRRRDLDRKSVV